MSNIGFSIASQATATAYANSSSFGRGGVWINTVTSSLSGTLNDIPLAVYNASPTQRLESQAGPLQADSLGNLNVGLVTKLAGEDLTNDVMAVMQKPVVSTTYGWTTFQNLGANTTLNVKASAGNVYAVYCYNTTSTNRFIQLHNTATVPAFAAVPTLTFLVPSSGSTLIGQEFFGQGGKNFATGIAFATSVSASTFISGAAADCITQIQYV